MAFLAGDAASDSTTTDAVSWSQVVVGVLEWLALHNDAVMTVLFLVLGVDLVSKGIRPLT